MERDKASGPSEPASDARKGRLPKSPLYVRAVGSAALIFLLVQAGFALLNVRYTPLTVMGVICLLAAPYLAYRAGKSIIKEITE